MAREALRAARDAAERARAEAEGARAEGAGRGSRASRRAAGPPSHRFRERRGAPDDRLSASAPAGQASTDVPEGRAPGDIRRDRSSAGRARDVRDLLADAFRLPSDGPETDEADGTPVEAPPRAPGQQPVPAEGESQQTPAAGAGEGSRETSGNSRASGASAAPAPPGDSATSTSPGISAPPGTSVTSQTPVTSVTPVTPVTPVTSVTSATPDTSVPPAPAGTSVTSRAPGTSVNAATSVTPVTPGTSATSVTSVTSVRPGTSATPASPGASVPPSGPRTMAAPSRDGELRRTFRPFPSRASVDEVFAESWWGNAWVAALEEGALDAARLARGRAYADKGNVDAITVTPGLVLAYVHGSRPRPYRVQVRLRTLDDDEWDRFLDAAAEQPGHIAALLDKEMPQALAGPVPGPGPGPGSGSGAGPGTRAARRGRGVRLLPGPGELDPRCSCPDVGHPCKHAAALCYQTARLLDEDPFVLLLLRGRSERELLDALSRRNAARAARAAQEQGPAPLPGVRARDALAERTLPPLPAPLPAPPHPEQPPVYPGAPGGPDPFALDQLATDAAARAYALLTTGRDPVAELTLWQDAVRLAAARPGSGLTATTRALYSSLAAATGRTPADLARAVAAWRQGGLEGLAVLEEPWDPPAGRFDRARPLLLAADLPAFRPWRNHLTHPRGHIQLRLGRDGLWYAYESEPGHDDWWPRGIPDADPVGALTDLGATED
ncbi:SWIM zinc finger family protein [Streptomyces sp. NPDC012510]|uniref:SWIM zinc finger family protein n=1 Tax=Streptomyces sp. NPDC012510 TaxID=3364838 RepID=UPI0036E3EB0A